MQIDVQHLDSRAVIAVTGELDMATVPRVRSAIPAGEVVLDLRGLEFIDSTGLKLLLDLQGTPTPPQLLTGPVVDRLLELCGLEAHFDRVG